MRKNSEDQLSFFNLKLNKGDVLLKSGLPYGEIVDESETLFYLKKVTCRDNIPSPCNKKRLIERIISGELSVESLRY